MELLRLLTLIYAAVLVVALAASLIAILLYLRRIADVLAEVGSHLTRARDETASLGERISPVQNVCAVCAEALTGADERLGRADARLRELADRLGAGQPAS